jgi:peptidoglycan hydrolase-like protein with peptidoglycan-binding domain
MNTGSGLLEADSQFGPSSEGAIIEFQEMMGVPANGVVDEDTWIRLFAYPVYPNGYNGQ